jgi:hypothetical protein
LKMKGFRRVRYTPPRHAAHTKNGARD